MAVGEMKLKHLEMIQGVINRLSTNSFLLKGWSVVLISAMFALGASGSRISFVFLAYFPACAFWILDGYFLREERVYRQYYDHVRLKADNEVDFSMDAKAFRNFGDATWPGSVFSRTLLVFHGVLIVSIVGVMVLALQGKV